MKAEQCTPYWGYNKRTLVIEIEDEEEIDRYYVDWIGVDIKKINVINWRNDARLYNTVTKTE